MLPGAELPHGQAERAKASAACLLCLSFKDDVVSEMTEPRSLPGAFQARPQEKHLNNRILLLAAPRVYRSGVCGALILAGAPPPACSYTSGEGDGCTNRRQSTFCVTVPLPGHRTATAVHSRRKGTGSLVAGGRRFAAGLAPRRTGTERVQAAHVPGRRDGSRSQPLKAGGGGARLAGPGSPEEPTQKVSGFPQKPQPPAKAPQASPWPGCLPSAVCVGSHCRQRFLFRPWVRALLEEAIPPQGRGLWRCRKTVEAVEQVHSQQHFSGSPG